MKAMICVCQSVDSCKRSEETYASCSKQDSAQHLSKPLALKVLPLLVCACSQVAALLSHTIWPSTASRTCSRSWSAMANGYAGCPSRVCRVWTQRRCSSEDPGTSWNSTERLTA
jgi:hypothetical protein